MTDRVAYIDGVVGGRALTASGNCTKP